MPETWQTQEDELKELREQNANLRWRLDDKESKRNEQRRYEIARDVMAASYANPKADWRTEQVGAFAAFAVKAADALLAALSGRPEVER